MLEHVGSDSPLSAEQAQNVETTVQSAHFGMRSQSTGWQRLGSRNMALCTFTFQGDVQHVWGGSCSTKYFHRKCSQLFLAVIIPLPSNLDWLKSLHILLIFIIVLHDVSF